jgi:hypothetical protein
MILQDTLRKDVAVPLQSQGTMRILSCIDNYHNLKQPSKYRGACSEGSDSTSAVCRDIQRRTVICI